MLGLAEVWRLLAGKIPSSRAAVIVAFIGVTAMLSQADGVVRYDLLLTRQDTRTITAQWLDANLPPGEQVIVEWYGPLYRNVSQAGCDLSDRPHPELEYDPIQDGWHGIPLSNAVRPGPVLRVYQVSPQFSATLNLMAIRLSSRTKRRRSETEGSPGTALTGEIPPLRSFLASVGMKRKDAPVTFMA